MKLELKHLAPYLPYNLQISTDDVGENWVETVIGLNHEAIETSVGNYWDYTVKPIFRPLSDFTKEIEHKGEKFIPIDNLNFKSTEDSFKILPEYNQWLYRFIKYADVQLLLEWHFDVYGLIDAGLAIDINTLNKIGL